jgi:transketolase
MPSWEVFERQRQAYRELVIPPRVTARISVEQAATTGWDHYIGPEGTSIGMNAFGASAPLKELQKKFGFTPERLMVAVKEQLATSRPRGRNISV